MKRMHRIPTAWMLAAMLPLGCFVNSETFGARKPHRKVTAAQQADKAMELARKTMAHVQKDDPGYKQAVKLVTTAIQPRKYRDINGTCGREPCLCKSCWVRKLAANPKP